MEVRKRVDGLFDGVFFYFGFTESPIEKQCIEILKKSPAEKIRTDLRRVNLDYREKLVEIQKEILTLEP